MVGLFRKNPEEQEKAEVFDRIAKSVPGVVRAGYRRKGVYEIIFAEDHDLIDPQTQALTNLLGHAWLIIWGTDTGRLNVGTLSKPGYRLKVDPTAVYMGTKYQDHQEMLSEILREIGIERDEEAYEFTMPPWPGADVMKRKVSKRWFEDMLSKGKIREVAPKDLRHVLAQESGADLGEGSEATVESKEEAGDQLAALKKKAERLVRAAEINAAGILGAEPGSFLERYSLIDSAFNTEMCKNIDAWLLVGSAGGVACGCFGLTVWANPVPVYGFAGNLSRDEHRKLLGVIHNAFEERFGENSFAFVNDCKKFIRNSLKGPITENTNESQLIFGSAGLWAMWNVLGKSPTTDPEDEAWGALGWMLGSELLAWWDESQWPEISRHLASLREQGFRTTQEILKSLGSVEEDL